MGILELGACHVINTNHYISAWLDPWIPSLQGFKLIMRAGAILFEDLTINNLLSPS
ncbi:hypothetical protein PanWU01x14_371790, partial [Parasponia andersonii]